MTTTNKDLFAIREGRSESKVVKVWNDSFKSIFLNEMKDVIVTNGKKPFLDIWNSQYKNSIFIEHVVLCYSNNYISNEIMKPLRDNYNLSEIVSDMFISWLSTSSGHKFIEEIYDIQLNKKAESFALYQYQDFDVEVELKKLNEYPNIVETVIDTLSGWLNSHVGRCFISDIFDIKIPLHDPLKTN